MSSPRVSVLVPAYKGADTIVAAVRSALEQTMGDLEVVVVDDHSQDGTREVLATIEDPRLLVLTHEENLGGNAARRTAIEASSGEFLAFLDADDLWLPSKLEKQLASLDAAGSQAGLSYTWFDMCYPDGHVEPGNRFTAVGLSAPELLQGNLIGTFSCVMVRREVVDVVGMPDASLRSCQDWEFYLRVNDRYEITCVPEVLVLYWRDDADAFRISASNDKVCAGHREVYSRYSRSLKALPAVESAAGRHYFMETFANHADLTGVAAVARDAGVRDMNLAEIRFITRMAARAARKSAAAIRARG